MLKKYYIALSNQLNSNQIQSIMKKITLLLFLFQFGFLFAQEEPSGTKSDTTKVQQLQEVQIVGSRNTKRTVLNSAVPIDIINIKEVTTQSGKIEINELLQYLAPSFNANKQSGSDGADHVDPASLRGFRIERTGFGSFNSCGL